MIVKKHISFLIALLILISSSGVAFSVRYCGGKIAAVASIFSKEEVCKMPMLVEKTCCAEQKIEHKSCCSDKKVNLKGKADQVIIKIISLDFDPSYFFEFKMQEFDKEREPFSSNEIEAFYCQANSPPLYKLYCQYTFYC